VGNEPWGEVKKPQLFMKPSKNLQLSPERYLRVEETEKGNIVLTQVYHKKDNTDFEFEHIINIPKLQRQNLADYLLPYE
jgi:hypothetical protein